MRKKLLIILGIIAVTIAVINSLGVFNHTGYVNAYEYISGGTYNRAFGIIGPDNRVYDLTEHINVKVSDLNGKEIETYSKGLKSPIKDFEDDECILVKVLESGEIYVISRFKNSSSNVHYWYQTYYIWSESDKKYVVKSINELQTTSGNDLNKSWYSKYGFVIDGLSYFSVYKFTSTGAEKLSGNYPITIEETNEGITQGRHSLYLGKDNSLYCEENRSKKIYKCTNGRWVNTGYSVSTYPDWKELVGINELKATNYSGVIEWHDSYMIEGKRYLATLPSATVYYLVNNPPVINETYPIYKILSADESTIIPKVYVTDSDNDNLTCRYYVDGKSTPNESKTITGTSTTKEVVFGAINVTGWKDGTHILKFEVSDSEKTVTKEVFINKVSVSINAKSDSITISQSGIDNDVKGKQFTYMYTVGSKSYWLTQKSYTKYSLIPNTTYAVNVEVKDELGVIYKLFNSNKNITTLAQTPKLKLSNPTNNTLELSIVDNNPNSTQYQVTVGNKYLNSSGTLTDTPTWITLSNKKLTIKGLTIGTTYQIKAKAKNSTGVETPYSNRVSGSTLSN